MARKDISFTAKDAALREDVHTLGALVGEVLRDQGGDAFFEEVEGDRQVAIRRRDGDPEAAVQLVVRADSRSAEQAAELIRAFGTWFQMVNMAERCTRRRRRSTSTTAVRTSPAASPNASRSCARSVTAWRRWWSCSGA
jgi:phosphoenolpyruvate carboxylase